MFFDVIQQILLSKRKIKEYEYSAVGDLLKNVYGTAAKIIDVIVFPGGGSTIKYAYDDENFYYYTTIQILQEKYFRMIEYSKGRMTDG